MKPTSVHYSFAQNWPARIYILVVPSMFVAVMAWALSPAPEIAGFEADAKSYLFLLMIALLLGLCVVAVTAPFILGPIYHYRAEQDGAPFDIGDRVEILVGVNRGQVARVAEVWEWRGSLRVDWSSTVVRKGKALFGFAQVIKLSDAEPPVAPD